jgi:pyruvoyl-dependent arginine decarboxylase (PvlArgDC)
MTAVAPWGENDEDAYDQGLVELGLGDARLIRVEGAMLPLGFEAVPIQDLPMGALVECHLAVAHCEDSATACAGVAWATATTPEGDDCAIVATLSTELDFEETELQLKRNLQRRLASRDLEVAAFDVAVDEVTAGPEHYGVALAALILPNSLLMGRGSTGRVRATGRAGIRPAELAHKAPAAKVMRPGARRSSEDGDSDFSL